MNTRTQDRNCQNYKTSETKRFRNAQNRNSFQPKGNQ